MMDDSFSYLRKFVPEVLDAVSFHGSDAAGDLIAAVGVLRELYAKGTRSVPDGAPTSFVPTRWRGYLERTQTAGDATAYRHYWELCVLYGLRDGLRSGDVHVPGSRRYADPAAYLITTPQWHLQRAEFCQLVGKKPDARRALSEAQKELDAALTKVDAVLADASGPVRLDEHGELVIGKLTAESAPDEAEELLDELVAVLPRIPLASLLIELDRRTGFTDLLIHAAR